MVSATRYWNRKTQQVETEQVYGAAALEWAYGARSGQVLVENLLSRKFFSQIYGLYQSSSWSCHKVPLFVREFNIPMEEFEDKHYESFNDFFIRRFKPGARTFVNQPEIMPAFAEARYLAYENVSPAQRLLVKGTHPKASALLDDPKKSKPFENGPLLVARLCPVDYHRFHFPDNGRVTDHYRVYGKLHSVNPLALRFKEDIFSTNERHVSILETENFGKLAYIEVGALCVGRIVQISSAYANPSRPFARGDEKGYFLFGASTVILMGEPGKWKPDADLLEQTQQGQETLIQLGESIGRKNV